MAERLHAIIATLRKLLGGAPSDVARDPSLPETPIKGESVIVTQQELARQIRALTAGAREPTDRELRELQGRCSRNLASEVPHFINHWLADGDVRRRDVEYAKGQAMQLEAALRQMEDANAT